MLFSSCLVTAFSPNASNVKQGVMRTIACLEACQGRDCGRIQFLQSRPVKKIGLHDAAKDGFIEVLQQILGS